MIFLYCIQESDKSNFIFRIANIIQLREDKIILPITGEEQITIKKAQKLAQKKRF